MAGSPGEHRIVPPLVIGERGALDFFRSVEGALSYVEAWFALEDYVAFDSAGRRLTLDAGDYHERPVLFGLLRVGSEGRLSIHPSPEEPDPAAAKKVLVEYLTSDERRAEMRLRPDEIEQSSLPELIRRGAEIEDWTA